MMQEGATLSDGGVPSEGVGTYFYIKGGAPSGGGKPITWGENQENWVIYRGCSPHTPHYRKPWGVYFFKIDRNEGQV